MKISVDSLVVIVLVFSLLLIPMFFSIAAIVGIDYEGSESSSIYIIYVISIFILSFFSYTYSLIKKGVIKKEIPILLALVILVSLHFIWVIFDQKNTTLFTESFILFVLLGLPGFFSAATMIKMRLINQVVKLTEVAILIVVIAIMIYSVLPTLAGIKTASLGAASYQTLSYYSSMAFGVLLTYNTRLPSEVRYTWTKSVFYKVWIFIALVSCLIGVFIGGGRGAFILLIFYITIWFFSRFRIKTWLSSVNSFSTNLVSLFTIISLLFIFITLISKEDFIIEGFKRATQYISEDGSIDIESGSSGRNVVYDSALNFIQQHPMRGYGPFGALDNTIQSHNIFLDIALQFGYIGIFTYLIISIILVVKAIYNWTPYSTWVFSLFMYPIVMLMFSGYYLHVSVFIFGVTFFMLYRKNLYKVT